MEELGLMKCRDTLIGGASLRGISGGERKRLSFATEILTNPSLLFVDEPTSGLDSFMAETVVLQLQQIARDGRTVIATIHQPSSELFALFDKLYLLSDGATVYHGKASESVEYFGSLGRVEQPTVSTTARRGGERHNLFFDGESRGNPGPGGAGTVLVTTDEDATNPRIAWSASMSYAQRIMTNNRAEYWGVITGLREARERGWKVEVVGGSNLILRQLAEYRPPRNTMLKPLYSEARRLADELRVEVWQHHLRAFNKMADATANAAMDLKASVQTKHPSNWGHTVKLDSYLLSGYREWHTRHILRSAQDYVSFKSLHASARGGRQGTDAAGVERIEGLKKAWVVHGKDSSVDGGDGTIPSNGALLVGAKPLGFFDQLGVLVKHNVLRLSRNKIAFQATAGQAFVAFLIVGLTYPRLDGYPKRRRCPLHHGEPDLRRWESDFRAPAARGS